MSMVGDERTYDTCAGCDLLAHEPVPCAGCVDAGNKHLRYGPDCSVKCTDCGERVCLDHFDAKAQRCTVCERARLVASGEARAEWKWGRDS